MNKTKIIVLVVLAVALLAQGAFMLIERNKMQQSEKYDAQQSAIDSLLAKQKADSLARVEFEQDTKAIENIWRQAEEESKTQTAKMTKEQQQKEEAELEHPSWIQGPWHYYSRYGTSEIYIDGDNITIRMEHETVYDGSYTIEDGRIVYGRNNGIAYVIPINYSSQQLMFSDTEAYERGYASY